VGLTRALNLGSSLRTGPPSADKYDPKKNPGYFSLRVHTLNTGVQSMQWYTSDVLTPLSSLQKNKKKGNAGTCNG
jgi:hypothetical protein